MCSIHVEYGVNGTGKFDAAQVPCMNYRGVQIPGTKLHGHLKFVWWCLIFVGPQCRTCFMSVMVPRILRCLARFLENLCVLEMVRNKLKFKKASFPSTFVKPFFPCHLLSILLSYGRFYFKEYLQSCKKCLLALSCPSTCVGHIGSCWTYFHEICIVYISIIII